MANMICLWGLCAKPACRRARACKRDPHDCLARYAPLVPEDAREDAPDDVTAVEAWIARVNAAAGKRGAI